MGCGSRNSPLIWLMGLVLVGAFGMTQAWAAATGPRDVVMESADRMIAVIKENRTDLEVHPEKLYGYVSEIILPHLDFYTASQWILGKHWRTASSDQRTRFAEEFRTMLVRTYARALLEYKDERLEFLPLKLDPGENRVVVEARFYQAGAEPVPIKYRMHNKRGAWVVWDVSIAGISVVTNFRSIFASQIQEKGLNGVIEDLARKNAEST